MENLTQDVSKLTINEAEEEGKKQTQAKDRISNRDRARNKILALKNTPLKDTQTKPKPHRNRSDSKDPSEDTDLKNKLDTGENINAEDSQQRKSANRNSRRKNIQKSKSPSTKENSGKTLGGKGTESPDVKEQDDSSSNAKPANPRNRRQNRSRKPLDQSKSASRKPRTPKSNGIRDSEISLILSNEEWHAAILEENGEETAISVKINSFPQDFPFDLEELRFALVIPINYPPRKLDSSIEIPEIYVSNSEIPVGVKANIENQFARKFRSLFSENPKSTNTIDSLLSWLVQNLESIFTMKPSSTIKFVSFKNDSQDKEKSKVEPQPIPKESDKSSEINTTNTPGPKVARVPVQRPVPKIFSGNDNEINKKNNSLKRDYELKQLEIRFKGSYQIKNFLFDEKSIINLSLNLTDPEIPVDVGIIQLEISVPFNYPLIISKSSPNTPHFKIIDENVLGKNGKKSSWNPPQGRTKYFEIIQAFLNKLAKSEVHYTLLQVLNLLDRHFVSIFVDIEESLSKKLENERKLNTLSGSSSDQFNEYSSDFDDDQSEQEDSPTQINKQGRVSADPGIGIGSGGEQVKTSQENGKKYKADPLSRYSVWPIRKGIEIRFGRIVLENVMLVTCSKLNLSVKCMKCKTNVDIQNIISTLQNTTDNQKWTSCLNCGAMLGVRFRGNFMYPEMPLLGFLDTSNCTPLDMKPSIYHLTCSKCSNSYEHQESNNNSSEEEKESSKQDNTNLGPSGDASDDKKETISSESLDIDKISAEGKISDKNEENVNSDSVDKSEASNRAQSKFESKLNKLQLTSNVKNYFNCMVCHTKLSVELDDFIFSKLTAGIEMGGTVAEKQIQKELSMSRGKTGAGGSKLSRLQKDPQKNKELLGIVLGTPLPNNGTCKHYPKSNRWFRFSCCMSLYPCDICHDTKEDHENEIAYLMLCGFCSKEQRIQKTEITGKCINCGENILRKKASSHWEGGKGTRNTATMSRLDSKKYRGLAKTTSNKKVSSKGKKTTK
ncbi:hypothetical protein BB560_003503 [Smittium megazygosporum]|uniref:CHY-type domain-containing protein n=1 Tax=Smittium megazygosporum TaxID=133381 RepID=A0A2T9ZBT7_9FUNG|nr:hypothetical protein BB560_003503 [Smittium megazygosporum]